MELLIIRGLPGSGKSTLAETITDGGGGWTVCEADTYFLCDDGVYRFVPEELPGAHAACQRDAETALVSGRSVIVANTASRYWEMTPYLALAERYRARATVIDLFDAGLNDAELAARCRHGVPVAAIARMRARWER